MNESKKMSEQTVEDVKKYWNARPCNIRHSSKPFGTKEYFDEVEAKKYFVEPHIPVFAQFDQWKGKKVLEIGCGIGTDTISFLRAGATVTSIDLSDESVKIAKQRTEVFGFQDKVTFHVGDAEHLSDIVPVETYDLVYSFGVIHHTPHPQNVMNEVKKYCGPNTTVKLMVYYFLSWKVFWIVFRYGKCQFWKTSALIAKYSEAQLGSPVTFAYTKKDVQPRLFKGFKITDIFVDHIFPYRFPDYKSNVYVKVWYFRILPNWLFRWLEKHIGWHLCVTAKPDNSK